MIIKIESQNLTVESYSGADYPGCVLGHGNHCWDKFPEIYGVPTYWARTVKKGKVVCPGCFEVSTGYGLMPLNGEVFFTRTVTEIIGAEEKNLEGTRVARVLKLN